MDKLRGKVALITGGTSGIGAATARLFREQGASVVATGSSAASIDAARAGMPGVEFVLSDAGDADAARALVLHVADARGRLDVLFANAGATLLAPIDQVDEAAFDRMMNLTVRGPFFLLKHAAPLLSDGGSIILTSSTAALRGMAAASVYSAGKAALRALGLSLSIEFAPRRIRVNTITPGPIATSIGAKVDLTPDQIAMFGEMIARVPLGRIGEASEIAAAALYLASDESRFTTGSELVVDGGIVAAYAGMLAS